MPLTKEQVLELKNQLKEQIKHLPQEQQKAAEKQIDEMSSEAIESMLQQQQAQQSEKPGTQPAQDIYRAIVEGKIPSKKIDENSHALAVLDIKPISKGHVIVIPKKIAKTSKDIPNPAFTLSKTIAKKIQSKLKAQGTEIQTQFAFGEMIINIIPIYDKPLSINSARYEASEEELSEVYQKIFKKPTIKKIKISKKPTNKNTIILKRKIP
jgi:diadenosine tetraphosphate (Ap4A) HIT family hydrolase